MSEGERTLPPGWAWIPVGDIASNIVYGTSEKTDDDSRGVPVLRMGNIVDGRIDTSNLKYLPHSSPAFPELLLEDGDILFNRTNSPELVGKSAVFRGAERKVSFASYLLRIRLDVGEPEYLVWWINSAAGREWVASVVSQQVGQANVNGTKLRALRVPIPPPAEQRRIVAQLGELLARSRRAKEALAEAPALLERYRQSVLAAAFRGELTADLRGAEAGTDGVAGSQLPKGWTLATVGELTSYVTSGSRGWSGYQADRGARFIRVGDLQHTCLDVDVENAIFVAPPDSVEGARTELRGGDVLVSITADVGMVGVFPDLPIKAYVNQHVALCRPRHDVNSRYLAYAMLDPRVAQSTMLGVQYGATKQSLSLKQIRELPVVLAPVEERPAVVQRIDQAMQAANLIEDSIREQIAQSIDGLDRTVMSRAFRGELVPQDPTDEPASVLLDRIRKERAAMPTRGPRSPRKTAATAHATPAAPNVVVPVAQWPAHVAAQGAAGIRVDSLYKASRLSADEFYRELRAHLTAARLREDRRGHDVWIVAP